jgi:hypothetical protein
MAQNERELVTDTTLVVVQIGVADTAGLDPHERLCLTGVRDQDRHLDGYPFFAGDNVTEPRWFPLETSERRSACSMSSSAPIDSLAQKAWRQGDRGSRAPATR